MSEEQQSALCQHKTVLPQDEIGSGEEIECHRDAAGEFELLMGDTVAAVMVLCDEHREYLKHTFSEVNPVDN